MELVSVIIPCRNEEKFIGKCLDSVIEQDYPMDKLEVLVVDGNSTDLTKKITDDYSKKFSFIRLFENPKKYTPFGLNIGVKESNGDIIIRMDSHATYGKEYISKCVKYLNECGADNVGGIIKNVPFINSIVAKAITICLSNIFGAGNSYFRIGSKKAIWVDTVFGGCYRRDVFDKIGLFNENLIRSQDMELNIRLKKAGGKILLVPGIVSYYFPKTTLGEFMKHNFNDGVWAIMPLRFIKTGFKIRHYILLFFMVFLIILFGLSFLSNFFFIIFLVSAGFYVLASLFLSFKISLKEKDMRYLFVMPVVFASRHFGYGIGEIFGVLNLLFGIKK